MYSWSLYNWGYAKQLDSRSARLDIIGSLRSSLFLLFLFSRSVLGTAPGFRKKNRDQIQQSYNCGVQAQVQRWKRNNIHFFVSFFFTFFLMKLTVSRKIFLYHCSVYSSISLCNMEVIGITKQVFIQLFVILVYHIIITNLLNSNRVISFHQLSGITKNNCS